MCRWCYNCTIASDLYIIYKESWTLAFKYLVDFHEELHNKLLKLCPGLLIVLLGVNYCCTQGLSFVLWGVNYCCTQHPHFYTLTLQRGGGGAGLVQGSVDELCERPCGGGHHLCQLRLHPELAQRGLHWTQSQAPPSGMIGGIEIYGDH